jgi:hypothetical protein
VLSEYKFLKKEIPPDKSINMICIVGGKEYDVYRIGGHDDIVEIDTENERGALRMWCPIEQISFAVIISPKTSKEPPREIGFKAIGEEHKKTPK